MSANNPDITAASIITDVEARLSSPGISTNTYLPWISYAYQRTYHALNSLGQEIREALFGDSGTISLSLSTLEYTITDSIPRFGSIVKVEVLYGASGDTRNEATKLRSVDYWPNLNNVSTSYRSKTEPVYYIFGKKIGIIPVPPEAGATAYIRYIKRPYQITDGADVIDIPYRFIYPIVNYIQAKAIETTNEDYEQAEITERKFLRELEEIQIAAASEVNENEGDSNIELVSGDPILYDPLRY